MEITIDLSEEDIRVCKGMLTEQAHFAINFFLAGSCVEDAVVSGIIKQISQKNIASSKDGR